MFQEKVNIKSAYVVRKKLEEFFPNVSIISKTRKNIFDSGFDARESMLFEARSLISGKNLAQDYGFLSFGMFKYDFVDWTGLQKTKFYHAFNGRDGKDGVSKMLGCIKLADNVVLVPLDHIDEFKEFLELWNLRHIYSPLLLPARVGKKSILEA